MVCFLIFLLCTFLTPRNLPLKFMEKYKILWEWYFWTNSYSFKAAVGNVWNASYSSCRMRLLRKQLHFTQKIHDKTKWLRGKLQQSKLVRLKYRATERCRSLVFFQTTWFTICWKVIVEFLPSDTKNKLPAPTLNNAGSNFISCTQLKNRRKCVPWQIYISFQIRLVFSDTKREST